MTNISPRPEFHSRISLSSSLILLATMLLAACKSPSTPPQSTLQPLDPPRVTISTQRTTQGTTQAASPADVITPTPAVAPETGVALSDVRGIKLRIWHTWSGRSADSIQSLEARFNGTNPWGILVEAMPWSGYVEMGQAVADSLGTPLSADVVAVPAEVAFAWNQGAPTLVGLNSYMSDPAWGMAADGQKDTIPSIWQAHASGEAQIGAPFGVSARFLAYNQTWARELGFEEPPSTPDEFKQQACAAGRVNRSAKNLADRGTGGWPVDSDPLTVLSWIAAFGGDGTSLPDQPAHFNTTSAQAAFTFNQTLFDEGCIWMPRLSEHAGYLAGRRALLVSANPQDIPNIAFEMTRIKNSDEWTLIPFPGSDGNGVLVSSGPALSIVKTTPARQLAAWLFIRWILEPQNQAEFLKVSFSLPSSYAPLDLASLGTVKYPQWQAAAAWIDQIQPGPQDAAWLKSRDVVEDAYMQLFRTDTEPGDEPRILELLDQTLAELWDQLP